jgi:hypothetical protein
MPLDDVPATLALMLFVMGVMHLAAVLAVVVLAVVDLAAVLLLATVCIGSGLRNHVRITTAARDPAALGVMLAVVSVMLVMHLPTVFAMVFVLVRRVEMLV